MHLRRKNIAYSHSKVRNDKDFDKMIAAHSDNVSKGQKMRNYQESLDCFNANKTDFIH